MSQVSGALNAICPYFTMFPLSFPQGILTRHARSDQRVLDPFCGRGTTNFAARLMGLGSVGVDSNPVAAAITAAKLASANASSVILAAQRILDDVPRAAAPEGEFWELAYDGDVLQTLCRLREGLTRNCRSDSRKLLRGIVLGALHGPIQKTVPGYFSNQCTRTYAPKPRYAAKFWRSRRMKPPKVDVLGLVRRRAERFLAEPLARCVSEAILGDSRQASTLTRVDRRRFDWVITSPPYYGMRTYVQDQWLRNWFIGGPAHVDYRHVGQIEHGGPSEFSEELRKVWVNAARACAPDAKLVIRFGGISDRKADPLEILKTSLTDTEWRITTVHSAGKADGGRRQADSFLRSRSKPLEEYDVWARRAS
jgi:hypothetical protein